MSAFAPVAGFTENWFPVESRQVLGDLGVSVADVPGLIVEIGSWEGRSTIALANAIHPRIVHAVDTWQGSPGEISADLAAKRDVFAKFQANISVHTRGNVEAHVCDWRDFMAAVDEPIALCFIDAEHSYTEVRDNIEAVLPWLSSGAVLCGDDAHHPPVQQALFELFDPTEIGRDATLWIWRKP